MSQVAVGRLPIQGEGGIDAVRADFTDDLVHVRERDSIRALDHPAVLSGHINHVIQADDDVIGVTVGGESRAYPLRVLSAHEVVNDTLGDVPIVVSFCPLCYSGIVFDRRVAGVERHFGVSGVLLNSDLVMFDRETDSLWSQLPGQAVAGAATGQRLTRIGSVQTSWQRWREAHPDTYVIDVDALGGATRYPAERFSAYYRSSQPGLYPMRVDSSLEPKELVLGVVIHDEARAFPLAALHGRVVQDVVGGVRIVVAHSGSGAVAFRYSEEAMVRLSDDGRFIVSPSARHTWSSVNGKAIDAPFDMELVDATTSFWFAWVAFYPDTTVFTP
jgi:hypothetical protein